jgi:carbamoyl-phosphate synthase small subunit
VHDRKQANQTIQEYFALNNLVGIADVDTRAIVRHIRQKGAMNCIISSEEKTIDELMEELEKAPSMQGLELSSKVSTNETYYFGDENSERRVAVLDLGVKRNILRCLAERDNYLAVFNCKTSFNEMMKFKPNGFMISNGPGDPSVMDYAVNTVKEIVNSGIPLFGICLGHQILAESQGIQTFKMHNGHRGLNHPVKNLVTGLCEITSQNHGFAVKSDDINNNEYTDAGQAFGGDTCFAQGLQPQRIGLLVVTRAATGGKRLEAPLAHVVEQGLGQDAAGRIVGA